jgi:hypothetical protein
VPSTEPRDAAPVHTADEYQRRIAARLVAANPDITYTTAAPPVLLAIPVLELEVDADGGVIHIDVVRAPAHADDTVRIAIDALRRAAPFGDASRVPGPWRFMLTFLFDDQRRFKPRVLD